MYIGYPKKALRIFRDIVVIWATFDYFRSATLGHFGKLLVNSPTLSACFGHFDLYICYNKSKVRNTKETLQGN